MELTELEKAVQELEEVTEPPTQEKAEITIIGRLSKAMEGLTGLLKKSAGEKETPAVAEKEPEPAPKEEPVLSKAQADKNDKDEVVDVTELLEDLRTGMVKSVSNVDDHVATLGAAVEQIASAVSVLCKSQKALHEMLEATPKSAPMLGVLTNGKGRDEATEEVKKSGADRGVAQLAIQRAVRADALEPTILGYFASHPEEALQRIPEDIAKSFNIPRTLR